MAARSASRLENKEPHFFREGFVRPQHRVGLSVLIEHFSVRPVVLNLEKHLNTEEIKNSFEYRKGNNSRTYFIWTDLLESPFIVSVFRVLIDESVQPLWDDGAVTEQHRRG